MVFPSVLLVDWSRALPLRGEEKRLEGWKEVHETMKLADSSGPISLNTQPLCEES